VPPSQPLPKAATGTDGDGRLDDVVARAERIAGRVDQGQNAFALVVVQHRPGKRRGAGSHAAGRRSPSTAGQRRRGRRNRRRRRESPFRGQAVWRSARRGPAAAGRRRGNDAPSAAASCLWKYQASISGTAIFSNSEGWMRVKPSDSQRVAPLTLMPKRKHQDQQDDANNVERNAETHQLLRRQLRHQPHHAKPDRHVQRLRQQAVAAL
jgi:hypothetical protein